MWDIIKQRLLSWRSSVTGLILLVVSFYFIYAQKTTFTEATPIIIIGLGLIGVKETKKEE